MHNVIIIQVSCDSFKAPASNRFSCHWSVINAMKEAKTAVTGTLGLRMPRTLGLERAPIPPFAVLMPCTLIPESPAPPTVSRLYLFLVASARG